MKIYLYALAPIIVGLILLIALTGCVNSPMQFSPEVALTVQIPVYNRGGTNTAPAAQGTDNAQEARGEALIEGGGNAQVTTP
jgi:hypothetical protein